MREMGELAGAPIEPPEQTKLLDKCCFQAGVIGGGVPGGWSSFTSSFTNLSKFIFTFSCVIAGGYDAVWLLMCEPEQCRPDQWPRERIEHVWTNYTELNVSPLSAVESMAKGARLEIIDKIKGLREVTQT